MYIIRIYGRGKTFLGYGRGLRSRCAGSTEQARQVRDRTGFGDQQEQVGDLMMDDLDD